MKNLRYMKMSGDFPGGCGGSLKSRKYYPKHMEDKNVGYELLWMFEPRPRLNLIKFRDLLPDSSNVPLQSDEDVVKYLEDKKKQMDQNFRNPPSLSYFQQEKDYAMFMRVALERGLELLINHNDEQ